MELSVRIESSAYLSKLLVANAACSEYVNADQQVSADTLAAVYASVEQYSPAIIESSTEFVTHIRADKSRFALLWSIAMMTESLCFTELGKWQSDFASLCVQQALKAAIQSNQVKKLYGAQALPESSQSGLFILAMGKLGGYDLNFSSDIDLVAFYDKERFECPRMQGASHVVTQILQQLTILLTGGNETELVWRVDWRLRPHASLRNLTMSSQSADEFYHYHAQPWHRLAMIKARVIAGDVQAGEQFLKDLIPFVWRHDLDYRAIDDIESLKHKINQEHPELKGQRENGAADIHSAIGFNIKLGHGGIREIEFIVNAMQLLWGGRKPELRLSNSMASLNMLTELGLYDESVSILLTRAYTFFRNAENALQMLENKQRYHLPINEENQRNLIALLSFKSWPEFDQQVQQHRKAVSTAFGELFAEDQSADGASKEVGFKDGYHWDSLALSEQAFEIVNLWTEGFRNYGVHESYAATLKPLAKELDTIIVNAGIDTEQALLKLDSFFHSLPPGGQYFRLLREYSALLDKLIQPLLHSKSMAILLKQSPHIIDRFLEECSPLCEPVGLDTSIIFYTADFETRLQNLRRLANEELYLIYLQYFNSQIDPRQFEAQLSYLARSLIEVCLKVTCEELKIGQSPIAVIGFGKLGMSAMMPMSDLDLVFVFDDIKDLQIANQFSSKLTTVISAPMKQGKVYELDTRLRPSGKSGAATISLQSFELHQIKHAHTWAHLALVPAKFIAGDVHIGEQFEQMKNKILSKPRDLAQYKSDCLKMLLRIKKQRTLQHSENLFVSKQRSGGLSEMEYLICCLSIVKYQNKRADWPLRFDDIVSELSDEQHTAIFEALLFMRNFQLEVRLFGHETKRLNELPSMIQRHLLKVFDLDSIGAIENKMQECTKITQALEALFFQDVDESSMTEWIDRPITWL